MYHVQVRKQKQNINTTTLIALQHKATTAAPMKSVTEIVGLLAFASFVEHIVWKHPSQWMHCCVGALTLRTRLNMLVSRLFILKSELWNAAFFIPQIFTWCLLECTVHGANNHRKSCPNLFNLIWSYSFSICNDIASKWMVSVWLKLTEKDCKLSVEIHFQSICIFQ